MLIPSIRPTKEWRWLSKTPEYTTIKLESLFWSTINYFSWYLRFLNGETFPPRSQSQLRRWGPLKLWSYPYCLKDFIILNFAVHCGAWVASFGPYANCFDSWDCCGVGFPASTLPSLEKRTGSNRFHFWMAVVRNRDKKFVNWKVNFICSFIWSPPNWLLKYSYDEYCICLKKCM